jgi:hypothetical protein
VKFPEWTSKPPSSLVETTEADLGTTSYTGVIRREADTTPPVDVEAWWAATAKVTQERDEARRDRDRFAQTIEFRVKELDVVRAVISERDATIERLWRELNEATNTPHNDPEFGFDKTVALSDPGTPMCRVHPEHFMPCSRCLGYGCTACDNGVQAADDRRSL